MQQLIYTSMLTIFQKYVKQHTFYFGIISEKVLTLQ